jgi:hypothetical protein
MNEIEVFILINANGEYVLAKEQDDLEQAYIDDIDGDGSGGMATRIIAVTLKVPTPEIITVNVEVPAEPTNATVVVS